MFRSEPPAGPPSGLYDPAPRAQVLKDLLTRSRRRLEALSDPELSELLEDTLFQERKRLEKDKPRDGELERLDALARALVRGTRADRMDAAMEIVRAWGDEIHGNFDPRTYRFSTHILPRALAGLLSARPRHRADLAPDRRIQVDGPIDVIRQLCAEGTVILAPTHVSNLDSPLIGLGLHMAGLPPFVYGAGLNLFSNPIMGFFMSRLGAYTVDRKKRAALYKDVLKDYSVRCLVTKHHSLFFPGGTRSRSGALETRLKKGLLGTGIVAWQEMLEAGRPDSEIYVVPLTLSFQLVLEAASLIEDHLEEAGKQRYIIDDDEFAQPRRLAAFARRVLDLDASVVLRFGEPLDCVGNPVSADADERREQAAQRRRYVCDRDGTVQWDAQRDHVYTDRLANAIVAAYPRGVTAMTTHLTAWVAWRLLEERAGSTDPFRVVRTPTLSRRIDKGTFMARLARARENLLARARLGELHTSLPDTDKAILAQAIDRFACYHRSRALAPYSTVGSDSDLLVEDPKLCLYYRNRLAHLDLDAPPASGSTP